MESPATWKTAELVIKEALRECDNARERGAIGASRASVVANALRASGHISDAEEPEIGWDGFRAHHAKGSQESPLPPCVHCNHGAENHSPDGPWCNDCPDNGQCPGMGYAQTKDDR